MVKTRSVGIMATQQLILKVGLQAEATFTNYYPGNNQHCVNALRAMISGTGERVIYINGSPGQGCSHLLQAVCHQANQQQISCIYIPLQKMITHTPSAFEGLELFTLVCIDDLQMIAQRPAWEEALFHTYNRIHDAGGRLVFAAVNPPKRLGLALADLVSRLSAGMVFQLQPLTDDEKLQALLLRAKQRGMLVTLEVGRFILNHCARDFNNMFAILDQLDAASLVEQRRLTIPFIKSVLQI